MRVNRTRIRANFARSANRVSFSTFCPHRRFQASLDQFIQGWRIPIVLRSFRPRSCYSLPDEFACFAPELYIAGDESEFFFTDADGVVCGTGGAAECAAFGVGAAAGDLPADEGECGAAGRTAVGVAVVAGRFLIHRRPRVLCMTFPAAGGVLFPARCRVRGRHGVCRVLLRGWFRTPASRFSVVRKMG